MTREQAAAYINAMVACANAEVAGMQAENEGRSRNGMALAYGVEAFRAVPEKWGIHHNAVLALFQECEP